MEEKNKSIDTNLTNLGQKLDVRVKEVDGNLKTLNAGVQRNTRNLKTVKYTTMTRLDILDKILKYSHRSGKNSFKKIDEEMENTIKSFNKDILANTTNITANANSILANTNKLSEIDNAHRAFNTNISNNTTNIQKNTANIATLDTSTGESKTQIKKNRKNIYNVKTRLYPDDDENQNEKKRKRTVKGNPNSQVLQDRLITEKDMQNMTIANKETAKKYNWDYDNLEKHIDPNFDMNTQTIDKLLKSDTITNAKNYENITKHLNSEADMKQINDALTAQAAQYGWDFNDLSTIKTNK